MTQRRFKKSTVAVVAAITAVVVAAAVAALIFFMSNKNKTPDADSQAIVYRTGDGIFLSAYGNKVELIAAEDSQMLLTSDGKYLIYTTQSAKVSKKYDIYACDISSSSKAKKGVKLLDYGVEKAFDYGNGILYYSKQNENNLSVTTAAYNIDRNKKADVDFAVTEMFIPSGSETVYYLKKLADSQSLYVYSPSEGSRELVKNAANVHFFSDGASSELFFETGSYNEGESELFKVVPDGNPVQIATMVSKVFYDNYVPGGNLYYLVKSESPKSWRDVIEDDMEQEDALIKEPNKNDYTFIFGFSIQYQLDLERYKRKSARDAIRQTLDEKMSEDMFTQGYTLYAASSDGSKKIAENVISDEVFAMSKKGTPSAIFISTQLLDSTVKMSDLNEHLSSSSTESVAQSAVEAVQACVKKSGLQYASSGSSEPVKLSAYDGKKADFILSSDKLFVKVYSDSDSFSLYKHTLSDSTVSAAQLLSDGVMACAVTDGEIWYQRSISGSSICELFRCSDTAKEKIDVDVAFFTEADDGSIIIAKNYTSSPDGEIADIYVLDATKSRKACEKVSVKSINYSKNGFSFLHGDELCIYSKNKLAVIDNGVYNIIVY